MNINENKNMPNVSTDAHGLQISAGKPKRKRRTIVMFGSALCVFMVCLLGVDYVLQPQRFPTRHIDVIGNMPNSTSEQIVEAVAEVSASNILRVDIAKVAEAAESLPWVEDATIRRKWPDTLEVQINERVILARWNDTEYLDQLGTVISIPELSDSSLPHLQGPETTALKVLEAYQSWNRVVANVDLEIKSVRLSERGSWEISVSPFSLADGTIEPHVANEPIRVIVGNNDMPKRSKRFLKLYAEIFQPVHEQVAVIDMRYPDGVSVTWKDSPPKMLGSATIAKS